MHFGIFNLMNRRDKSQSVSQLISQTVEQVQAAETAGFGVSWFTEHHFSNYSLPPSPLMMVGYVAPQTLRIKLGTSVILPALYQAPRLLGELAFADKEFHYMERHMINQIMNIMNIDKTEIIKAKKNLRDLLL